MKNILTICFVVVGSPVSSEFQTDRFAEKGFEFSKTNRTRAPLEKRNELLEMDRQGFLSALTPATSYPLAGAHPATALAMDGGGPVRTTPLTTHYKGANFINDAERTEVVDVVESRNLFRFYGFSAPKKVRTFEEKFQKFLGVKYALAVTSGTGALPKTVELHKRIATVSIGPKYSDGDLNDIIGAVKKVHGALMSQVPFQDCRISSRIRPS
jgi:hypothetical protein